MSSSEIYVPFSGVPGMRNSSHNVHGWVQAAKRIGATIVYGETASSRPMAVDDPAALAYCSLEGNRMMPVDSYRVLAYRQEWKRSGLKAIDAIVPTSSDGSDLAALGSGQVFVRQINSADKRRSTHGPASRLNYTFHDSVGAMISSGALAELLAYNNEHAGEQYVLCVSPSFGEQYIDHWFEFTVNEASELCLVQCHWTQRRGVGLLGDGATVNPLTPMHAAMLSELRRIVKDFKITSGYYFVQCVEIDGELRIYDWNCRGSLFAHLYVSHDVCIADRALAHMLGRDVTSMPEPQFHHEVRSFFGSPFRRSKAQQIVAAGMTPQASDIIESPTEPILRVGCLAPSKADVDNRFLNLNQIER